MAINITEREHQMSAFWGNIQLYLWSILAENPDCGIVRNSVTNSLPPLSRPKYKLQQQRGEGREKGSYKLKEM